MLINYCALPRINHSFHRVIFVLIFPSIVSLRGRLRRFSGFASSQWDPYTGMDMKLKRCGALINVGQAQGGIKTRLSILCPTSPLLLISFPKIVLPSSHIQAPFMDDYCFPARLSIQAMVTLCIAPCRYAISLHQDVLPFRGKVQIPPNTAVALKSCSYLAAMNRFSE